MEQNEIYENTSQAISSVLEKLHELEKDLADGEEVQGIMLTVVTTQNTALLYRHVGDDRSEHDDSFSQMCLIALGVLRATTNMSKGYIGLPDRLNNITRQLYETLFDGEYEDQQGELE